MNNISQRFEIKANNDSTGSFTAYGNVFNVVDEADDITMKGAFLNSIKQHKDNNTMPRLLEQHGHRSMPIGIITDIFEDTKGLKFSGELNLETQAGREAYALLKQGAIDTFSIGYITLQSEQQNHNGQMVRALLEVDLKEISLVTFACNPESRIESIKSALSKHETITTKMVQKALQESGLSNRQAEQAINQIKSVDLSTKESEMTKENIDLKSTETINKDQEQKSVDVNKEQKQEQKSSYWMKDTLEDPIVSVSCLQDVLMYLSPTAHQAMIAIAETDRIAQLAIIDPEQKSEQTLDQEHKSDQTLDQNMEKELEQKQEQKSKEIKLTTEDIQGWFKE